MTEIKFWKKLSITILILIFKVISCKKILDSNIVALKTLPYRFFDQIFKNWLRLRTCLYKLQFYGSFE